MVVKFIEFEKSGARWKVPDAFYRVSAKVIIKNDRDELLVLKDRDGEYEIPGGGIEWGENYTQALTRELREELAVELASVDEEPFATEYAQHKKGYYTYKIYCFGTVSGRVIDNEPEKLTHIWVTKERFSDLLFQSEEAGIQKHRNIIWP